jgi:hypothetical protein
LVKKVWILALLWDFAFQILNLPPTTPRQYPNNQRSYGADSDEQSVAESTIKQSVS